MPRRTLKTTKRTRGVRPDDTSLKAKIRGGKELLVAMDVPHSNMRLFEHYGVNRSTGYRYLRDHDRACDETRGRKRAISEAQLDQLEAFLQREGWEGRSMAWSEVCDAAGLEFPGRKGPPSAQVVQQAINRRGWRKCTACTKFWVNKDTANNREHWARERLHEYGLDVDKWRRIRYSDVIHFKFGPEGKMKVVRRVGERYCTSCIQHRSRPTDTGDREVCLSAWAAIGYGFKSPLVWYDVNNSNGAITQQAYRDQILEPVVKTWLGKGHDFVLEEDSGFVMEEDDAAGHGGQSDYDIVQRWKEQTGLGLFFDCPGAPNLAPIENVWKSPKTMARRYSIWDEAAMKELAEESWEALDQKTIDEWCDSIPERMFDVIDAKGQYAGS
ncbi:hypothetical protein F5Y19DRAFT_202206 [Xylariaceae sp. FL1651]|nr:hypothetical protein F5Y19DRAFT_202206 [Xylariaceae sp. FL1651]